MIDLIGKFKKLEKQIRDHVLNNKGAYYDHRCSESLRSRHDRLKSAIDMKSPATQENNFNSKLVFPYVRQQYLLSRAVKKKNFRNDPLFTLEPGETVELDNAKNMQEVLGKNMKATQFRNNFFDRSVDTDSRYGVWVGYSRFEHSMKQGWKTVLAPDGSLSPTERQWGVLSNEEKIMNHNIHPLNYFQDPMEIDSEKSNFRGIIDSITGDCIISDFKANPQNYIKENVVKIIRELEKTRAGEMQDEDKFVEQDSNESRNSKGDQRSAGNYSQLKADIVRIWSTLPIVGNEDDSTTYYLEIIGNTIVRFQVNPNDENICPITTGTSRKRLDFWWGNNTAEDSQPFENFITYLLNMKADQAFRLMDSMIFMPDDIDLNMSDINNRHQTGGIVRYGSKEGVDVRKLMVPWQPQDNSGGNVDYIVREAKEIMDRLNPAPDFNRGYNQGGSNNDTATAAVMQGEMGDTLQSDMLEVLGGSYLTLAKKNVVLLQQYLGDNFNIRPDIKEPMQSLTKASILGDFVYNMSSSLNKSRLSEFTTLHNLLTGIGNFKGTPDQTWQNVNTVPLVTKYLKAADIGDTEVVFNEQQVAQQQAQQAPPQQIGAPVG